MSRVRLTALLVVALLALPAAPAAAAEVVRAADLLADSAGYGGQVITVEGELIGDYGRRSDGSVWTQLNDDAYAREPLVDGGALAGANVGIGIRLPWELAVSLDPPGGYRVEGPLVRATGRWLHHDPDRQGESYLDVESLTVVEPGRRLEEGPNAVVMVLGGVALAGAAALGWLGRRRAAGPS